MIEYVELDPRRRYRRGQLAVKLVVEDDIVMVSRVMSSGVSIVDGVVSVDDFLRAGVTVTMEALIEESADQLVTHALEPSH